MIIYFDGGSYNIPAKPHLFLSTYGVLFHNGQENPIELYGEHELNKKHYGNHELIAFLQAFKLLKENNINYKNVSFYSDLSYIQTLLHEDNYRKTNKDNFLIQLDKSIELLNLQGNKNEIIDCIKNCRIVKIKGHANTVDNIRVDYLAKIAHAKVEPISYVKFLEYAFFKYTSKGPIIFNLPFMEENKSKLIKI